MRGIRFSVLRNFGITIFQYNGITAYRDFGEKTNPKLPPVALPVDSLPRLERILHQRADGHRANAAGNGRDEGALGSHFVELDVTLELEARLLGGIGNAGGAHIDDRGALLHHVGGDELRLANGCDKDISRSTDFLEVFRSTVAHGHCGIAGIGLLHHQLSHGLAHDVRTSKHYAVLALGLDMVALQQVHDAHRCSAHEAGKTDGKTSNVDWMKSVHILAVIDSLNDLLAVDVLRQRKLHNEAIDLGILVQFVHLGKEFLFGDITLETNQ